MHRHFAFVLCLFAATTIGCGGGGTEKLDANPDVDYQALEAESEAEEDIGNVDTRALEK